MVGCIQGEATESSLMGRDIRRSISRKDSMVRLRRTDYGRNTVGSD